MSLKRGALFLSLIGLSLKGLGDFSNDLVVMLNSGRMPVRALECIANPKAASDGRHVCITAASHLTILADYIRIGDIVYSPGDITMFVGWAMFALLAPVAVYLYLKDR